MAEIIIAEIGNFMASAILLSIAFPVLGFQFYGNQAFNAIFKLSAIAAIP